MGVGVKLRLTVRHVDARGEGDGAPSELGDALLAWAGVGVAWGLGVGLAWVRVRVGVG